MAGARAADVSSTSSSPLFSSLLFKNYRFHSEREIQAAVHWAGGGRGGRGKAGPREGANTETWSQHSLHSLAGAGTTLKDRTLNSEHRTEHTPHISMASTVCMTLDTDSEAQALQTSELLFPSRLSDSVFCQL